MCREVLYNLIRSEGQVPSCHDVVILRTWVNIVGEEIGVPLKATQSLMSAIWKRASKLFSQFKKLKGGRQELKLELKHGDLLKSEERLQRQLSSANKENERLQAEVSKAAEANEKLTEEIKTLSEHVSLKVAVFFNSQWNIFPTPEGSTGVQQKLEE